MNKKAFTLIELLATIVVLAIISLIAIPIVLNIINNSKNSANKISIDNYAKAIEKSIAKYQLSGKEVENGYYNPSSDGKKITKDDIILNIEYNGNNVKCDTIKYNKNGSLYLTNCSVNGKYIDYTYGKLQSNVLMQAETKDKSLQNGLFLSTEVLRKNIKTLIIQDSINIPSGYSSSDCSLDQDKSVMCWWKEDTVDLGYYNLYIGGDGDVTAPEDSSNLFAYVGYDKMEELDLNILDTLNVTNMSSMFYATGYNHIITLDLGENFDTSSVKIMDKMFYAMSSLRKLNLGDKFNTSEVTDMSGMFYYMWRLEELDLKNKFNTAKVTDMSGMFTYVRVVKLGENFDTSSVKSMDHMFERAYITNLGNKFDTSNVTDMHSMFEYAGTGKILDLGNKFDTSNVTDMHSMFYRMEGIEKLDLGENFDTSNVTNMKSMFWYTGSYYMTSLDLGKFGVNLKSNINTTDLFTGCGKEGTLTNVVVYNNSVKNWIDNKVPDYWKNNNIITVK